MSDDKASFENVTGSVPVVAGPDVMLKFQDSTYVEGASGSSKNERLMPASQPPSNADDSFSTPGPGFAPEISSSKWGFLSVGFYRPYFDVDTSDVFERIKDSLIPYSRSNFLEKTSLNPDILIQFRSFSICVLFPVPVCYVWSVPNPNQTSFHLHSIYVLFPVPVCYVWYGPFWICTTLIFVTAALGNLSAYLSLKTSYRNEHFTYDIHKVTYASAIFYGYCGLVPLSLYFILKYFQISSGLIQLWCLYGYSLFVFIPISFLSVVPLEPLRWAFVILATIMSSIFLGLNLRAQLMPNLDKWMTIVIPAVALQMILGLVLKLFFFTYSFT